MMSSDIAALLSVSGMRSAGSNNGRSTAAAPAVQQVQGRRGQEEGQGDNRHAAAEAVEELNEFAKSIGRDLQFSVDEDLGRIVITVKDIETDEVIRMIPGEEALKIAKHIQQNMSLLFDQEA